MQILVNKYNIKLSGHRPILFPHNYQYTWVIYSSVAIYQATGCSCQTRGVFYVACDCATRTLYGDWFIALQWRGSQWKQTGSADTSKHIDEYRHQCLIEIVWVNWAEQDRCGAVNDWSTARCVVSSHWWLGHVRVPPLLSIECGLELPAAE